jgi:hypothetical protein
MNPRRSPRPRIVPGLVLVPLSDGLLVDGTERLQFLEFKPERSFIPHLIALLDGTRTLPQIERAFPNMAGRHVRAAVSLLRSNGLVEDIEDDPSRLEIPESETIKFLSRYKSVTEINRSGIEAYEKLLAAELVIIEGGEKSCGAAEFLGSLLQDTGISRVQVFDQGSPELAEPVNDSHMTPRLLRIFCTPPPNGVRRTSTTP